jgi:GNAT superfamily N-acetyltransferase
MSGGYGMLIVAATASDLRQILDLQYLAWQSEAKLLNNHHIQPLRQTYEELEQEFKEGIMLKALGEDGGIIGSVRAHTGGDTLFIGKLMVHPAHQRKGIGSLLLRQIETVSPMPRYELFTSKKSISNIRLYEKHGYRIYQEVPSSSDITFVYMEKHNV